MSQLIAQFLRLATLDQKDFGRILVGIPFAGSPVRGTMYYSAVDEEAAVATAQPDRRLTYDDLLLLPDDGQRHEIIDGVHYVTPSPSLSHQELVGRLHLSLGGFVEDRPDRGRVILAPFDVVFSFHDVVEPDLVFVASDQLEILTEKNIRGTPALVIEVLSPSTRRRDQGIKLRLYDRTGVREYWLIDPVGRAVTVYRRAADALFPRASHLTAEAGDTLDTALLPGWSLSMARLFR